MRYPEDDPTGVWLIVKELMIALRVTSDIRIDMKKCLRVRSADVPWMECVGKSTRNNRRLRRPNGKLIRLVTINTALLQLRELVSASKTGD
jgi:hypothetical protein